MVLLCCGVLLSALSYFLWDERLAYYCQGLNLTFLGMVNLITHAGDSLWYYILLIPAFLLARLVWKNELWSSRSLYVLLCLSLSGIVSTGLKWLAGRHRPINLFEDGLFGFEFFKIVFTYESTSFPSGHSVTAFALATAISFIYPRWSPIAIAIAILIALSRVALTAHYLSDVIAGAVVGSLCSMGIKFFFDRYHFDLSESASET